MNSIALIAPDFLIILLGTLLAGKLGFPREFWKYAEKLVFYVLFPPLLFTSISTSDISLDTATQFLAVAIGAMLLAVLSAWAVRWVVKSDDWTHASVFHCGFRFNTYIGFAVCLRLFGDDGFALLALLIAFWVPISNTIAVGVLAAAVARKENRPGKSVMRSTLSAVVKNPLIIATVLGLIANVSGLTLSGVPQGFLKGLGNASLAMGLLCIGAGLHVEDFKKHFNLIAACTAQRLVVVPLIAWGVASLAGLPPLESGVLILFAALPTAQSCYVMTANMRGNAPLVADVTTAQTLAAMATLTVWIAFVLTGLAAAVV